MSAEVLILLAVVVIYFAGVVVSDDSSRRSLGDTGPSLHAYAWPAELAGYLIIMTVIVVVMGLIMVGRWVKHKLVPQQKN